MSEILTRSEEIKRLLNKYNNVCRHCGSENVRKKRKKHKPKYCRDCGRHFHQYMFVDSENPNKYTPPLLRVQDYDDDNRYEQMLELMGWR